MKVVHIISGISRNSGGPSRSSQGLVAALNAAGVETWLLSCRPGEEAWVPGVTHFRVPTESGLKALGRFFEEALWEVKPDLIHLHGIWAPQIHVAAKTARKLGFPYIISPRGMLEPWSLEQKKWKKWLAMALYQRNDLKRAVALHATAATEAEQFRRLGFRQRIIELPNGVILPESLPPQGLHADGYHRALFVSRIHKKKGLLELVEAWGRVRPQGWKMEIVGTDADGYQVVVEQAVREYDLGQDFIFSGPLMDERKWEAYRRADLFILPTYSENFGIVVPEALYAGVPVITTKGTPWQELQTHRCGWWIDIGVEPLVDALREALALSDSERAEMGVRGRDLVNTFYTWPALGQGMAEAYRTLLL